MIPYEEYLPLLPHEYTYAQFLSYEFDLWMYDPMILNMVSERYPRDEDDASDFASDPDSDIVTDEDFGDDIPRWLFLDSYDDEGVLSSLPQQAKFSNSRESLTTEENDFSEFVFGNFGVSYLDIVTPIKPIKPEIEGCMVKIGEIHCSFAAVEQSSDGGSGIVASQFMDLESDTVNLQSNTTERIATRFGFASATDCNIYTKDEAKEITKKENVAELNDSSIAMTDFIFMATRMSTDLDLAKQLQERIVFSEIVPLPFVFNNSASRCTSIQVRLTWFDFLFTAPNLVHSVLLFRLKTNASSPKKTTECGFAEKATSMFTTSIDPGGTLQKISNFAVEVSVQSRLVSIPFRSFLLPSITNQISATILMFSDLFSCMVKLLFYVKPFSITSPEPPWNILLRRFQPHDPGDPCSMSPLRFVWFQKLLTASWLLALPWASHALFGLQLGFWPISH